MNALLTPYLRMMAFLGVPSSDACTIWSRTRCGMASGMLRAIVTLEAMMPRLGESESEEEAEGHRGDVGKHISILPPCPEGAELGFADHDAVVLPQARADRPGDLLVAKGDGHVVDRLLAVGGTAVGEGPPHVSHRLGLAAYTRSPLEPFLEPFGCTGDPEVVRGPPAASEGFPDGFAKGRTVALVSQELGRRYLRLDGKREYTDLAREWLVKEAPSFQRAGSS